MINDEKTNKVCVMLASYNGEKYIGEQIDSILQQKDVDIKLVVRDDGSTDVFMLKDYINEHIDKKCLSHIDAVPDNFLFTKSGDIRLIDWEYAGMQDPHVDIAMFCIFALYNKQQVDRLINIYFENKCEKETRLKIYCYIAACGLLWSNWCEYKRNLGVEFGEYSLRQYRFAKDYYKFFMEEMIENESR